MGTPEDNTPYIGNGADLMARHRHELAVLDADPVNKDLAGFVNNVADYIHEDNPPASQWDGRAQRFREQLEDKLATLPPTEWLPFLIAFEDHLRDGFSSTAMHNHSELYRQRKLEFWQYYDTMLAYLVPTAMSPEAANMEVPYLLGEEDEQIDKAAAEITKHCAQWSEDVTNPSGQEQSYAIAAEYAPVLAYIVSCRTDEQRTKIAKLVVARFRAQCIEQFRTHRPKNYALYQELWESAFRRFIMTIIAAGCSPNQSPIVDLPPQQIRDSARGQMGNRLE